MSGRTRSLPLFFVDKPQDVGDKKGSNRTIPKRSPKPKGNPQDSLTPDDSAKRVDRFPGPAPVKLRKARSSGTSPTFLRIIRRSNGELRSPSNPPLIPEGHRRHSTGMKYNCLVCANPVNLREQSRLSTFFSPCNCALAVVHRACSGELKYRCSTCFVPWKGPPDVSPVETPKHTAEEMPSIESCRICQRTELANVNSHRRHSFSHVLVKTCRCPRAHQWCLEDQRMSFCEECQMKLKFTWVQDVTYKWDVCRTSFGCAFAVFFSIIIIIFIHALLNEYLTGHREFWLSWPGDCCVVVGVLISVFVIFCIVVMCVKGYSSWKDAFIHRYEEYDEKANEHVLCFYPVVDGKLQLVPPLYPNIIKPYEPESQTSVS